MLAHRSVSFYSSSNERCRAVSSGVLCFSLFLRTACCFRRWLLPMSCYRRQSHVIVQVMNVAFLVTALLCTIIGGCGYYMFGSAARDVVTFNLPAVRPLANLAAELACLERCNLLVLQRRTAHDDEPTSQCCRDDWRQCVHP